MSGPTADSDEEVPIPVIDLSRAPGRRQAWDKPPWMIYLWSLVELVFVTNALQPSSGLRRRMLIVFGARIGEQVVLRPRLRVKFPWNLEIGDRSWIGEDVWIHNQDRVTVGADAVISQGSFVTTGSHRYSSDMALVTQPVTLAEGVWVTARCVVLAGSQVGRSALVLPGTVVRGEVPAGVIYGGHPPHVLKDRFPTVVNAAVSGSGAST